MEKTFFLIPQANNTQLTRKEREMWNITSKALMHLGVILVVDVFFHYLYILTIPSDMKLVTKLSDWCLGEFHRCLLTVFMWLWLLLTIVFPLNYTVSLQ